jgi:hypothetical protein
LYGQPGLLRDFFSLSVLTMTVRTLSTREGTGSEGAAARLAVAAPTPSLDQRALALFAHELNPRVRDAGELERRIGGVFNVAALSIASANGSVEAFQKLQLRKTLPEFGRAVISAAADRACVILAPAAFAALPEHPAAVHARLHAAPAQRIKNYQRGHLVNPRRAEKTVRRDDHLKRTWVKALYQLEIDGPRPFCIVLDTSRLSTHRLVDVQLTAGGTPMDAGTSTHKKERK